MALHPYAANPVALGNAQATNSFRVECDLDRGYLIEVLVALLEGNPAIGETLRGDADEVPVHVDTVRNPLREQAQLAAADGGDTLFDIPVRPVLIGFRADRRVEENGAREGCEDAS
jgi:hypothetical protein